jgi:hypothetical protein
MRLWKPTEQKTKQREALVNRFTKLTTIELRYMLFRNQQSTYGSRQILAERVAEGVMFGRIPPCNSCEMGKLRFDFKTGKYTCPGFYQNDDYVHCGNVLEHKQVKREAWIH